MSDEETNAHTWKEDGTFHFQLFLDGDVSIEFCAPSWRRLKALMREQGYETTVREKDLKDEWRMPGGDMWLATG